MKALLLTAYNSLSYTDVSDPQPGPREVLVRVMACGICGSDIHGLDGSSGRRIPPLIMGHEAAGVIAAVGEEVTGRREGDRVTFDSTISCGTCWYCRRGEINLCEHRRVLGVSCDEYRQHGAFAEYVVVPQQVLYRLPVALDFVAATFIEPLSVAQHAFSLAPDPEGTNVVVIGAGVIGLLLLQLLRAAKCSRVIAVDINPERLTLAKQLGATDTLVATHTDAFAAILELGDPRGVDIAFEAVGIASTVNTAIQSLRKGGTLVQIGNITPRVEMPLQAIVARQLSVLGSCASAGEFPTCLDLLTRGVVRTEPLTSAIAPLSEGASWFERLRSGKENLIKVILQP